MSLSSLFFSLEGTWAITRSYSGKGVLSEGGSFLGKAVFQKETPTLYAYHEEGTFQPQKGLASRTYQDYFYQQDETITVLFRDHRPLYPLVFKGNIATALHICACDIYTAEYQFLSPIKFISIQLVKGPKKDYKIISEFTKKGKCP